MDDADINFIRNHPYAGMITLRPDGRPHVARMEAVIVDGRLCSTSGPSTVRERNLRRDPSCTLFFPASPPDDRWVAVDTTAVVTAGPAAAPRLLALARARHGVEDDGTFLAHDDTVGHDQPFTEAAYLDYIAETGPVLIDFDVVRVYGNR